MSEPLVCGVGDLAIYKDDGVLAMSLITGKPIPWRWSKPWLASIHMPTEAARTVTRYEDICIERVQEISEEDAKAEGVKASSAVELKDGSPCYTSPFQLLWEQIHGIDNPKAWDVNP